MKINLSVLLGAVLIGSVMTLFAAEPMGTTVPVEKKVAMTKPIYVCPDCETMAMKAGKCEKCGKAMKETHVLGVKSGKAMLCDCAADCKCDAKGMKDGKCGCGTAVKSMSVKGMYVCPEGCPDISDKPGKCMCGKEMKKAE